MVSRRQAECGDAAEPDLRSADGGIKTETVFRTPFSCRAEDAEDSPRVARQEEEVEVEGRGEV